MKAHCCQWTLSILLSILLNHLNFKQCRPLRTWDIQYPWFNANLRDVLLVYILNGSRLLSILSLPLEPSWAGRSVWARDRTWNDGKRNLVFIANCWRSVFGGRSKPVRRPLPYPWDSLLPPCILCWASELSCFSLLEAFWLGGIKLVGTATVMSGNPLTWYNFLVML